MRVCVAGIRQAYFRACAIVLDLMKRRHDRQGKSNWAPTYLHKPAAAHIVLRVCPPISVASGLRLTVMPRSCRLFRGAHVVLLAELGFPDA